MTSGEVMLTGGVEVMVTGEEVDVVNGVVVRSW